MKCRTHQDKESKVLCGRCKEPLCEQCAIPCKDGFLCSRCIALEAAQDAAEGIGQRIEIKNKKAGEREERKRFKKKIIHASQLVLIVIGLCIIAVQVPDLLDTFNNEKPLRNGAYETDVKTDQCIRNLWEVAKILQEGKKYQGYPLCPASKKPFIVTEENGDLVARSPNPELYGFREIRVSKKRPVPEVIR